MASFFEWIIMGVQLLVPGICEKFIELVSGAAHWILDPSSRRSICAQPASTKDVLPPPPPKTKVIINIVSSDVKENNISTIRTTAASSSTTTDPERSGSWDIIKTDSYNETIEPSGSWDIIKTDCYNETIERSGSWDIIKTDNYDETIEGEILQDIEPLVRLSKSILHSENYKNGDRLTEKDETDVMELLKYHSGFQKKIGSRFSYIMVDRHVEFEDSRCMYVVRTDGSRMDISYRKCLRGYLEWKYPAHAEKFAQSNPHLVKVK